MLPPEVRFIEVAKRYAMVGMQATQAFNAEQAKLELGLVLSPNRLSSTQGTQTSIETLDYLTVLTAAHKAAFERILLSFAKESNEALSEIPEGLRIDYQNGVIASISRELAAQSQFYENRSRWIDAARRICTLVDSRRTTSTFSGDTIIFADDEDYELFESLEAVIEEVHQQETKIMHERLERVGRSLSVLGSTARE